MFTYYSPETLTNELVLQHFGTLGVSCVAARMLQVGREEALRMVHDTETFDFSDDNRAQDNMSSAVFGATYRLVFHPENPANHLVPHEIKAQVRQARNNS